MSENYRAFVLPTQEDIAAFAAGKNPGNVLLREFATEAEYEAYVVGINVIEDENDELDGLERRGAVVVVTRNGRSEPIEFTTEAEAEACQQGIDDSDGFHGPEVIPSDDERFDRLVEFGHLNKDSEGPRL
jgi:hypothetical protein